MGFLTGKRVLIVGLLSKLSIAHGIASVMHREGAELAFSYQNERFKDRVTEMAAEWGPAIVWPCDVSSDQEIDDLIKEISTHWGGFDILVHSVAFAPKELLEGDYLDSVTREGFKIAHDVSSYSFAALAKAAYPLMKGRQGSMLTLSYLGVEKTVPNYNVMGLAKASLEANVRYMARSLGPRGIRVNAISAGPIRTLAACGIQGFRQILEHTAAIAPMRANVTTEQVGNVAAFLCSDLASGITGEIVHVDSGIHSIAMGDA